MTREEAELVEPGTLIALVFESGQIHHVYRTTSRVTDREYFPCVSVESGLEQYVAYHNHSVLTPRVQLGHEAVMTRYAYNSARGRYRDRIDSFRDRYAEQVNNDLKDVAPKLPVHASLRYELFTDGERVSVRISAAEFSRLMGLLGVDARVPDLAAFRVACTQEPDVIEAKEAADSLLAKLNEQIAALKQGEESNVDQR